MILPRANSFQSVDCSDCQYYLSLEGQRSIFWLTAWTACTVLAVRCWQDGQPRLLGKFGLPGLAERASRSGQTVSTVCSWTYLTSQPFHGNSFNSNCDAKTCQKLIKKRKKPSAWYCSDWRQLSAKSIPKILWTIKKELRVNFHLSAIKKELKLFKVNFLSVVWIDRALYGNESLKIFKLICFLLLFNLLFYFLQRCCEKVARFLYVIGVPDHDGGRRK